MLLLGMVGEPTANLNLIEPWLCQLIFSRSIFEQGLFES